MNRPIHRYRVMVCAGLLVAMATAAQAAQLWVYAVKWSDLTYVRSAPYVSWSAGTITSNQTNWIYADQFLDIRTDQPYQSGAWAIQVFTDNVRVEDARVGGPPFHVPDWRVGGVTQDGGTIQGPLTPPYVSTQVYTDGSNVEHFPKSGLIAADGQSRLPMTWRVYNALPNGNRPPAIVEDSDHSPCDFADCAWAYFLDKGDKKLLNGAVVSDWDATCAQSEAPNRACYSVPLSKYGWQGNIGSHYRPDYGTDGTVDVYLYVASNFRNGTRQMYSTTLFVELLTF